MTAMDENSPIFAIAVAAELAGMHPQTLRMYEARGLIRPGRTAGGTRLYSDSDVERLREILSPSEQEERRKLLGEEPFTAGSPVDATCAHPDASP